MVILFILLFLFDVAVGVLVWWIWQKTSAYLRSNPEAAKVVAEIIASLLTGKTDKPEVKKTKGTLV